MAQTPGPPAFTTRGEQITYDTLARQLPNSYYVLSNITLGGQQIDVVVVGPHAVFAIEDKYWAGQVDGWTQGRWYHNGEEDTSHLNPLQQADNKWKALRSYCVQTLGEEGAANAWFQSVLNFSHPKVDLDLDWNALESCYKNHVEVTFLPELVQYIVEYKPRRASLPASVCKRLAYGIAYPEGVNTGWGFGRLFQAVFGNAARSAAMLLLLIVAFAVTVFLLNRPSDAPTPTEVLLKERNWAVITVENAPVYAEANDQASVLQTNRRRTKIYFEARLTQNGRDWFRLAGGGWIAGGSFERFESSQQADDYAAKLGG